MDSFLESLVRGNRPAWERFLKEFGPVIVRAARAVGERLDADDISQKVLTSLTENNYRLLRSFEGRSTLSTWLIGITRRQALMQLREDRRRTARAKAAGRSLLDDLEQTDARASLEAAMAGLAPRERLLIALYYYEELSYEEIGSVLGVSANSVSPMLQRMRERLRDALLKF